MLRSNVIILAITIMNIVMVNAQTLSIGPIAGVNVSNISNITNSKSLTGLLVGGFGNYSINEHAGLTLKVLYSQLGTAVDNNTEIIRLNYIQIPLTGVYYFGQTGNKIRPKIYAGPFVGFLINAKDGEGNEITSINGSQVFNNTDIGALLGAGLNALIYNRTWLNLDIGYAGGFTKITDNASTSYKNRGVQIAAGVSFPIGN